MCDSCPASGSSTTSSPSTTRPRPQQRVTLAGAARRDTEPSRPKRGPGSAAPWSASSAGTDEELEADQRGDGIPRQAENERRPRTPKRRLPGPDGHAPEDLLDAQLGRDPSHEVVLPDRRTAGRDEHIGLESPPERRTKRVAVIGHA